MELERHKRKQGMMRNSLILIMLCGLLAGCGTVRELNGVKELTDHPQFPKAAQQAPEGTRAALEEVAKLEYEIERGN